jgi:RNA polymerase sigma-70 factor (ECF subfamily)
VDKSFAELYELYVSDVYRLVLRLIGDVTEAEDLTAETFVRAYHGWSELLQPDRARAWLFQIAYNLCMDAMRRQQRMNIISLNDETAVVGAVGEPPLLVTLESDAPLPSEGVLRQEIADFLQGVLLQLSPLYRAAIVMGELEEMSNQKIANVLHRSATAVKSLRQRARKALRDEVLRALKRRGAKIEDLL